MSFTFDASDCLSYLKRCEEGILEAGRHGARVAALEAWKSARSTDKWQNRTGTLRASIQYENTNTSDALGEFRSKVTAGARYATFVEAGTRPHMIVGNPMLTFVWKGVRVHFRYVRHPGTKPTYFMQAAARDGESAAIDVMNADTERATR